MVAALHLLRGRKLLGKDLGSASLSLSLGCDAIESSSEEGESRPRGEERESERGVRRKKGEQMRADVAFRSRFALKLLLAV